MFDVDDSMSALYSPGGVSRKCHAPLALQTGEMNRQHKTGKCPETKTFIELKIYTRHTRESTKRMV